MFVTASNHRRRSRNDVLRLRRRATVVVQEAAEPLPALDRCSRIGVVVGRPEDCGEQPIVEALVIALEMVMRDELRDCEAKVALAERNELVQTFFLDREYEALGK